jgi:hypothetical protein
MEFYFDLLKTFYYLWDNFLDIYTQSKCILAIGVKVLIILNLCHLESLIILTLILELKIPFGCRFVL